MGICIVIVDLAYSMRQSIIPFLLLPSSPWETSIPFSVIAARASWKQTELSGVISLWGVKCKRRGKSLASSFIISFSMNGDGRASLIIRGVPSVQVVSLGTVFLIMDSYDLRLTNPIMRTRIFEQILRWAPCNATVTNLLQQKITCVGHQVPKVLFIVNQLHWLMPIWSFGDSHFQKVILKIRILLYAMIKKKQI